MFKLMSNMLQSVRGPWTSELDTPSAATPKCDRAGLINLKGGAQVVFFDFDGTLTATPGDRAKRPTKTKELCARAPMLKRYLQKMREADIIIGIISKSTEGTIKACLEAAEMSDLFNGPIVGKAVGFDGKPGFIKDFCEEDGPLAHLGLDNLHLVLLVDDDISELERCRECGIQTYPPPEEGGLQEADLDKILEGIGLVKHETMKSTASSALSWETLEPNKVMRLWTQGLTGHSLGISKEKDFVEYSAAEALTFQDIYDCEEIATGGEGAFGACKFGTHKASGVQAIVKFVRQQDLGRRQIDMYFHPEKGLYATLLRMTREMRHKNVVGYLDFLAGPNWVRGVMEPLNGPELYSHLQENAPVNEAYIREVMHQTLSGLHYLHSSVGVMHRDVKVDNLRFRKKFSSITGDAELVLVDFGFVCDIEPKDDWREVVGTLTCMAPEVFSHYYHSKADMWSAGVALYVLLTGKQPWMQNPKITSKDGKSLCERAVAAAFRADEFLEAPPMAVEVVEGLLVVDQDARLGAAEALDHPWFSTALTSTLNSKDSSGFFAKLFTGRKKTVPLPGEEAGQLVGVKGGAYKEAQSCAKFTVSYDDKTFKK